MITLRQHIPNFMSGFDPNDATIDHAEDFRTIDWVKRWEDDGELVRWSQSPNSRARGENNWLLMAEMADGRWWVVAYVNDDLGLPEWKHP